MSGGTRRSHVTLALRACLCASAAPWLGACAGSAVRPVDDALRDAIAETPARAQAPDLVAAAEAALPARDASGSEPEVLEQRGRARLWLRAAEVEATRHREQAALEAQRARLDAADAEFIAARATTAEIVRRAEDLERAARTRAALRTALRLAVREVGHPRRRMRGTAAAGEVAGYAEAALALRSRARLLDVAARVLESGAAQVPASASAPELAPGEPASPPPGRATAHGALRDAWAKLAEARARLGEARAHAGPPDTAQRASLRADLFELAELTGCGLSPRIPAGKETKGQSIVLAAPYGVHRSRSTPTVAAQAQLTQLASVLRAHPHGALLLVVHPVGPGAAAARIAARRGAQLRRRLGLGKRVKVVPVSHAERPAGVSPGDVELRLPAYR